MRATTRPNRVLLRSEAALHDATTFYAMTTTPLRSTAAATIPPLRPSRPLREAKNFRVVGRAVTCVDKLALGILTPIIDINDSAAQFNRSVSAMPATPHLCQLEDVYGANWPTQALSGTVDWEIYHDFFDERCVIHYDPAGA